jgi:hypothetical protein
MEDKFLQFAIRWKYRDNQWSALSPFSPVAFVPGVYEIDYGTGENKAMLNTQNEVDITFGTGSVFVDEIQLVARDTKSLNVSIVETFDKSQVSPNPIYNGPLAPYTLISNSTYTFRFKNNRIYTVLTSDQVTRLFDNVPVKAKSQEIIDRRLVYGNYTQFYDLLDSSGRKLLIDYEVGYLSEEVASGTPIQTFRSDRDYEIAIQYGEEYGRFTTALTPPDNDNTIYIPPTASVTGNSIQVSITSKAPVFATHYRLMIKESKKSYYNLFPILYYQEGQYRWFLINPPDKNKIKIGEYVLFKSDAVSVIESPQKYKIIDIAVKPTNFLLNGEIGGIYFKIKAEDNDFPVADLSIEESDSQGYGVAGGLLASNDRIPDPPVTDMFQCIEYPIFYGTGEQQLGLTSWAPNANMPEWYPDFRYTIVVQPGNKISYTVALSGSGGWIEEDISIGVGVDIKLPQTLGGDVITTLDFASPNAYTPGDKWVVNIRNLNGWVYGSDGTGIGAYQPSLSNLRFFASGVSSLPATNIEGGGPGFLILPSDTTSDLEIGTGAIVQLDVTEDYYNNNGDNSSFTEDVLPLVGPSPKNYENIEEWFYESGAYILFNKSLSSGGESGHKSVSFRRGTDFDMTTGNGNSLMSNTMSQGGAGTPTTYNYPIRMIIRSSESPFSKHGELFNVPKQGSILGKLKITQQENQVFVETEPLEVDNQIFHEIPRTFPISNNEHQVLWRYTDYTSVDGGSRTRLGFAIPSTDIPSSTDIPHYFHVGDTVWITSDNLAYGPSSLVAHTIDEIEDQYNIIISTAFPGNGPVTGGGISLTDIEQDQNSPTTPAIIKINNPGNPNSTYNGYAFGNGLESDRIRDDFNETELQYSPRASVVIDDYEEETKEAALCYSGIYKGDSSINRLNEFNLSKANFKNLDRQFGSIQKLFARDTNILVMQEDKISQILYGKNLLSDSAGGGIIASVPEVLGTQTAYAGEYGISFNPESFANWGNDIFWADERRGSVLKMTTGQIVDISEKGMKDYFRDLFKDNPRTQKLGVYDPYRHQYIIASNEDLSVPCILELSSDGHTYPATNPGLEEISLERPDFTVTSNTSWTVGIVYSAGTNWVTGYPTSGTGDWEVHLAIGDNRSGSSRTATITFTYCDGETATFVVTQSKGRKITVHPIRIHNGHFTKF